MDFRLTPDGDGAQADDAYAGDRYACAPPDTSGENARDLDMTRPTRRARSAAPLATRQPARRRGGNRTVGTAGQLRTLSLRLELAREDERARVARELHDELGQILTSLKLEFMWLVDQIKKGEPRPRVEMVNKLQSLIGLVEISIQSVRQISGDLRPALLDHLGLPEAVQWEATKFEARTGIRCRFANLLKRDLSDPARAMGVFRILQEALTNVARHAHAGAVRITLREERGRTVHMSVKDNGRGISRSEASSLDAIGLLGMRERARLLGGRMTIAGGPGRGTIVNLWFPAEVNSSGPPARGGATP